MLSVVLLAIAGAVIASVVGTIWYSGATPMGRIHMRSLGFDKLTPEEQQAKIAEVKPKMPKMYAGQFVLSLLLSFAVVFIVTTGMRNGLTFSMTLGFVFVNWLCFMVPIIGSGVLWSNTDRAIAWKKFFSDAFANLVTVALIALLASFFA